MEQRFIWLNLFSVAIQLIGQHIKDILVVKEPLSVRQPIRLHTTLSEPGIISFLNNLNALCPKEWVYL